MSFEIIEKSKKILLMITMVAVIEFSGYGFYASLFRLIGSAS